MQVSCNKNNFSEVVKSLGIELSEKQLKQYEIYANMLVEWNEKMNLTAILDIDQIYERHFLDSILPAFETTLQGSICDVGAGAGFPSIPLKILLPHLKVTIVETLGKRITFLKALCEALEIEVELVHARSEEYALTHRESFDFVTARAVANLSMLCELCIPLVRVDGIFLALKGSQALSELEQAKKAIKILGCKEEKIVTHEFKDHGNHINLHFRKIKACDKKYPRAFAKIKKNPL